MKIRVRFEKTGPIRFVGHLDFMRTFQKILKKSGLHALYTAGFNPHILLSFADPLGVGEESTCEYADIEFAYRDNAALTEQELYRLTDLGIDNEALPDPPAEDAFLRALNEAAPDGVRFTSAVRVGLIKGSKAMALVRAASFLIPVADSFPCEAVNPDLLERFMLQDEIIVRKVTKKSEKDVDIRPEIREFRCMRPDEFPPFFEDDAYAKRSGLYLTCSAGSQGNLKPQTAVEALCAFGGIPCERNAYRLIRTGLYDAELRPLDADGTKF